MSTEYDNMVEELLLELYRVLKGRSFSDPEVVAVSQRLDHVMNRVYYNSED